MRIVIRNQNGSIEEICATEGQSLLEALQNAGKPMFAPCGGEGTCGRCRVLVRDAEGVGYKLACETPAQDGTEIMLEDLETVKVAGVTERSEAAPTTSGSFGLAIDIGSTTMVFHLVDLESKKTICSVGRVNPQVVFGGDVIARINVASKQNGLDELCSCLRGAIDEAIGQLCKKAAVDEELIGSISIVGNTTMEHFATGLDPVGIGVSPFTPQSLFGCEMALYAAEGQKPLRAYLAPAVAGYVGGDITAGIHATGMRESDELQLLIDIGTNGEMALGSKDGIVCCATAAGPAFEGASITLGMPAMPGAVSSVSLKDGHLEIKTVDDAPAVGICGSGLLDAVAALVECGLVDETGYLADEEEADARWAGIVGEEEGQTVCYLDEGHHVYLAQSDIRKVQLAKAAIRAGIETMMSEMGADYQDIGEVALAGGFGMHLNPKSATAIGLIPPALDGKVRAFGNTAGAGAVACLFADGRNSTESIASTCEYLELSTDKRFNELYIDSMGFDEDE